jgi:hypothetical protein
LSLTLCACREMCGESIDRERIEQKFAPYPNELRSFGPVKLDVMVRNRYA